MSGFRPIECRASGPLAPAGIHPFGNQTGLAGSAKDLGDLRVFAVSKAPLQSRQETEDGVEAGAAEKLAAAGAPADLGHGGDG